MNQLPPPVQPPKEIELEHVLLAIFRVKGVNNTQVIEVPHTQKPDTDMKAAWNAIRAKFPKAGPKDIVRTGAAVQSRPKGQTKPIIPMPKGSTIRQLFSDGSDSETSREVGRVIFDRDPCIVIARFIRAKGVVSFNLKAIGTGFVTRFSKQHTAMQEIGRLPILINDTLAGAGQELEVYVHETVR